MGLFSDIGKAIGRAIGRGVEKVGDVLHIEPVSDFGKGIQSYFSEKIASEKSYDRSNANANTTDRLNEILVSYSEGYLQYANKIEKNCIKLVEEHYDKLIGIIEDTPDSMHSEANLKMLKSGKDRISKTIDGAIKKPLAQELSLDNTECLSILKLDSGEIKKQKMNEFTGKVINSALKNLAKNVRAALNDQTGAFMEYLQDISEEQEKAMQSLKNQIDKLLRDSELEQCNTENSCVIPLYVVDISESVIQILEE